jgi:hypothetical protein
VIPGWRSSPCARFTVVPVVWWCAVGDRIVLDARADDCCVLALENPAVTRLFDVLGEWLG